MGPSVRLGEPPQISEYTVQQVSGVKLYVPQGFTAPFELTVEVHSFFGLFKTLHLEGWKMI
ncbi:MAG: hypothetical protein N2491_08385 [Negativicutes bacterium]|nr:hypothetical protein [Negativicutes bacterium]